MAFGWSVEGMASTPPPAILFDPSRSGPCELTYARFHFLWTIPALVVLLLVSRPFLTRLDHAKLAFLPAIALIWTTAWDSQLIRRGAWTYPRQCVLSTVWFVPVEEYFFVRKQRRRTRAQADIDACGRLRSSPSSSPSLLLWQLDGSSCRSTWLVPSQAPFSLIHPRGPLPC